MGVYKGIKWCGLRESTLSPSPSHYELWGCRGNLEDSKGEMSWGQPWVWGFFVTQTSRLLGNGHARVPWKMVHTSLQEKAPWVLGVPDEEDAELCFGGKRKLQARCLKGE